MSWESKRESYSTLGSLHPLCCLISGGKRFVNSFKRRAFLAHIVESALPTHIDPSLEVEEWWNLPSNIVVMPFPILYRRKPLRGWKRWLTFLAPGSFFVYVTKRAGLWSVLLSPEQEKGCRWAIKSCISPESEENAPDILIGVGFTRLR